jgi:hypothetical protein
MALGCQQGQKELFVPVGCLKLGGEFFGWLSNKASEPVPIQK